MSHAALLLEMSLKACSSTHCNFTFLEMGYLIALCLLFNKWQEDGEGLTRTFQVIHKQAIC